MSKIRELRERRAAIHAQAQEILQQRTLTSEDRQKFDAMMAEMDSLKGDIDRMERAEANDADLRQTRRPPEAQIGSDYDVAAQSAAERRERTVFKTWLKFGVEGLSSEDRTVLRRAGMESRDMGVGTGSLGGYFVPQGFVYDVDVALKYYGNMLGVSKILDTATGQPLPYPTANDTTVAGEIVGEGQQVSTADVNIGHIIFGAYKFSTKLVKVSMELLQDSAFDMESFLKDQFAIRLGRILNTKFTVGAGTTEPTGIMTVATAGPTAVGSSANTGGSQTGANSIGYIDLVELEHSVDPLYRRGAKFMMHDQTLKAVKEILDKYGRPIWVPGVATNRRIRFSVTSTPSTTTWRPSPPMLPLSRLGNSAST